MIEEKKLEESILEETVEDFKKDLFAYWDSFLEWESTLVIDPESGEVTFPGTQITFQEVDEALTVDPTMPLAVEACGRVLARHPGLTVVDLEYCLLFSMRRELEKLQQAKGATGAEVVKGAEGKND